MEPTLFVYLAEPDVTERTGVIRTLDDIQTELTELFGPGYSLYQSCRKEENGCLKLEYLIAPGRLQEETPETF
jgi:hypothetical protein